MKSSVLSFIFFLFIGVTLYGQEKGSEKGEHFLEMSKRFHDKESIWSTYRMGFRIQEPRVENPRRFSELHMDNSKSSFVLKRMYDSKSVEIAVVDGDVTFRIDGKEVHDMAILEKYRLSAPRAMGYYKFYKTMYGIPMSIDQNLYDQVESVTSIEFRGKKAFLIGLSLKEEMISKKWGLIVSEKDYSVLGLEIYHPKSEDGERETIWFDGLFERDGIIVPRFRHWFLNGDGEYLGSDIIVLETK